MYEWIKALHIIAVIAWMAGMLYLPRLFVYHCEAEIGSKQSETFKRRRHRAYSSESGGFGKFEAGRNSGLFRSRAE